MTRERHDDAFLDRRQFLMLGAAAALTPWAEATAAAPAALSRAVGARADAASVGFLVGSDRLAAVRTVSWQAAADGAPLVVPAARLPRGDRALAGAAVRLTVHGLYPRVPESDAGIAAATLEVLFPAPESAAAAPIRVLAWRFDRRQAVNVSPGASLVVPVAADGALTLVVATETRRAGGRAEPIERVREARFTVGSESGRPKLRPGLYLLGLAPRVWRSPAVLQAPDTADAGCCSLVVGVAPLEASVRHA